METIASTTINARYSDVFDSLLESMGGGKELLKIDFESDYQGFVDADVLLNDGRVISYRYYYGSCSGCDEWESRAMNDKEIMDAMSQEATVFNNIEDYNKFNALRAKSI